MKTSILPCVAYVDIHMFNVDIQHRCNMSNEGVLALWFLQVTTASTSSELESFAVIRLYKDYKKYEIICNNLFFYLIPKFLTHVFDPYATLFLLFLVYSANLRTNF